LDTRWKLCQSSANPSFRTSAASPGEIRNSDNQVLSGSRLASAAGRLGPDEELPYSLSRRKEFSAWRLFRFRSGRTAGLNPSVASPDPRKPLRSRDSTPSAAVLVSDRTSRMVKYASTYPSLRPATSSALLRFFPGYGSATLGAILTRPLFSIIFSQRTELLWKH